MRGLEMDACLRRQTEGAMTARGAKPEVCYLLSDEMS
jgi:hypothetical protein